MADPNEVLGTFFGDETFPIEWESEEEKSLFWFVDDNHCPRPISPMYWSLDGWWGPTLDYMYRRFGFPIGKAWIGKRVNGYLYTAIVPREAESASMLGPYYGWIMPTYASKFLDWWNERYLPEIERNFEYLDNFPTEEASLQELMVFLEEAIDIQERHFRLHWILNLAQFQSSLDLQAAVGEVVGQVDPALIGRILISIKDRNWDSLGALWKLKEQVKADPELNAIFEAGETAGAIIPQLQKSARGQDFLAGVEAYNKEFGVKPSMYTHEYTNKLWVEDSAPAVETIKGYLAADYDFPTEYNRMKGDHEAAIAELKAMVPPTATPEQCDKLDKAIEVATRMMPLTPDHHFYMDQGTFARMRLVLLAIGRRMVKEGLLRDPEDIMFLEYDQLRAYVGNPTGYDGQAIIKEARRAWDKAHRIHPRDWVGTVTRWSMYEEIYHTLWGWPERWEREQAGEKAIAGIIKGLPAAAGVAEGTAKVVTGPEEFNDVQRGDILVCRMTNPAWVVLFSKIKGVVTDAGGVLSHTAVVAREFGLPAVVGSADATVRIKSGDRVRVNGNTGIVEILN
ncbi:MAG: PEP-utilizing protein mobile subunit [Anaerolineaceae bacterium]|nr:PEP-utilizing protein mobile subunit [Anaerolineaceae bacterium]